MKKDFSELAWDVSEKEYRQDPALSYSTLAKYEREGFEHLNTLFDKVESPSLLLGSCVDTLLTDGEKAFNEQFFISDIVSVEPKVEPIVKELFKLYNNSYTDLNYVDDNLMLPVITAYSYQPNWRSDTRCRVLRQKGAAYYRNLFMAKGKKVVTQNIYDKAFTCVQALKNSSLTGNCFKEDDPFEDIKRYYQLKFKTDLDGITYRCMMDLIIVDYENKIVHPYDLKTSSHMEYDFPKSLLQWRYDIQGRLYSKVLRKLMDEDDYFKDFKLDDFQFIVCNTIDLPNPLIWRFEYALAEGTITLGDTKCRDPKVIGAELHNYLTYLPKVPKDIKEDVPNSIVNWFNTHDK